MANKRLFSPMSPVAPTDTVNEAGGVAYLMTPKHTLAQMAATGCLNGTFYASAESQLDQILAFAKACEPSYVARVAAYARESGYMKDAPALLVAHLFGVGYEGFDAVFDRVIDNGKMLRNFCQIVRSGKIGRKSFGSKGKRAIRRWLDARTDDQVFRASVGNDPSLADVIKMVHPKGKTKEREALYGHLIGKEKDGAMLTGLALAFEQYKKNPTGDTPDVPWEMLAGLALPPEAWKGIARSMRWQGLRMNLATLKRHGVFDDAELVTALAARLKDPEQVKRARAFPYQLLMAFKHTHGEIPHALSEALQDAMEAATQNVPEIAGDIVICPDVSGSMRSPVTGDRGTATTKVLCVDVAALVMAAVVRRNPGRVRVLPFDTSVYEMPVNARDSVMTLAGSLARVGGGGTSCSMPLLGMNAKGWKADLVIYVSDNQSWADFTPGPGTAGAEAWHQFKRRNPKARLACVDLQPLANHQFKPAADTLLVGGWSDTVFDVLKDFASGGTDADLWVSKIEAVAL